MPELQVEYRSVDSPIPYARNARTHSDEQVVQIAASIREFGFTNPVLVDEQGGIIANGVLHKHNKPQGRKLCRRRSHGFTPQLACRAHACQ